MSTTPLCPDSRRLEPLLRADLPAAEQASLEFHLKTGDTWRAELDELTGQVGLLSETGRREVSDANGPNTALRGATSRLNAAGAHSAVSDGRRAADRGP